MSPSAVVVLLAAGSGSRFGANIPKAFFEVNKKNFVVNCLDTINSLPFVTEVFVAVPSKEYLDEVFLYKSKFPKLQITPYVGGDTRRESVALGLDEIKKLNSSESVNDKIVLVHDSARFYATSGLFNRVFQSAVTNKASVSCIDCVDSVLKVNPNGEINDFLDRKSLKIIQTPQAFEFSLLEKSHREWDFDKFGEPTDDASMVNKIYPVAVVEGEVTNVKVTYRKDIL
jgi:2-C-methyl-D-erythritol 4-phosphate cytidylyltransferase